MRLLFVLPEYPPDFGGGIATFYEALLPELVDQGHDVHVLIGSAMVAGGAPYERDGVRVSFLEADAVERWQSQFGQYDALPEVQRYLAAAWALHETAEAGEGYDAIEVVDWGLLFVPWMIEARAPVVVQLHGSSGQIDLRDPSPGWALQGHVVRLLEAGLLRAAAALHTHSFANKDEWEAITGRAVDYFLPPLATEHQEVPVVNRADWGLVVGRVQQWKGPTVLCEALRELGDRAPRVKWVGRDMVYGDSGTSMATFLRDSYPSVWGTTIEQMGQVAPADVAALQAEAGFVVVPSLWDVFNLTAVEAMRSAAVVICSQGAGAADLIEDGVNGLVFATGDAKALASRLALVAAMPDRQRAEIGAAARRTIRNLHPSAVAARKADAFRMVREEARSPEPNSWEVAAVRPASQAIEPFAYLDHKPLRGLLSYSIRRIKSRLH